MCGRFENRISLSQYMEHLPEDFIDRLNMQVADRKTINIAPTEDIIILQKNDGKHILDKMSWGIKFKEKAPLIFNSRIETIREKPFWKGLFHKNRLLVPMSAFYEWIPTGGRRKQPLRISLPDNELFFVPALFTKIGDTNFASLVTTEPNDFMMKIHNRMPVILTKDKVKQFFENDVEANIELCVPFVDGDMDYEEIILN